MILVDSSIWIDHLRRSERALIERLEADLVLVHPAVIGELACGSLKRRRELLTLLRALPAAAEASSEEVLRFIDQRELYGRGVGWVDAQLLASALLSRARLWTRDRRLLSVATQLDVALD